MNNAVGYILHRFFFRLTDFFHHWYVDGSKNIFHRFISILESIDRVLAIKVTARHIFKPLYGDYSPVGRTVGPIFRLGRILIGALIYIFCAILFLIFYLTWLSLPVFIIGASLGAFSSQLP